MTGLMEFINTLFGIDNSTSAPILITLIVFIGGLLINWIYMLLNNIISRNNVKGLVKNMICEIIKSCDLQSKNFDEFVEEIKMQNSEIFSLKVSQINSLDSFNRLEYKLVYESYFSGWKKLFAKKRLKAFNKMWAMISKLNYWDPKYIQNLTDYNSNYNRHLNKWNESMDSFRRLSAALKQNVNGGKPVDKRLRPYVQLFNEILVRWQEKDDYTHPANVSEFLVEPLLDLNKDFEDSPFVIELDNYLLDLKLHYINLSKVVSANKSLFISHKYTYQNAARILKVCLKIL